MARRLLPLALLSGTSVAFRMHEGAKNVVAVEDTVRTIAGVPVYNYHLAKSYKTAASGLLELEKEAEPENWVLMAKGELTDDKLQALCGKFGSKCLMQGHGAGVPFVEFHGTEKDLHEVLDESEIEFVEPDMTTYLIPELPENETNMTFSASRASSWGLDRIGTSKRRYTGRGVHIYVLDTGVRVSHGDFGGRAVPALEVVSSRPKECSSRDTSCAADIQGHGTHCAGTAGGSKFGVAPDATIHAVKVLGDDGRGSLAWMLQAIDWVTTKGQRPAVVSMSLGGPGGSRSEQTAIDRATRSGVTVVVAAGNDNDDACRYSPAFVPSAITVGSTDSRDSRSYFSNYGRCVQIYAPGSDITSAGHRYDSHSQTMSGTSMACPHVSGAAALLLEEDPSRSPAQVLSALRSAAESGVIRDLTSADPNLLLSVG